MKESESGQSLVELVAAAPLILVCGLLGMQALVYGACVVYADNAAHAAAIASQLGTDPSVAARRALPGWARGRSAVTELRGTIEVVLRPRAVIPALGPLLRIVATANVVEPAS